jgi:hypothetical protein
MGRKELVKKIFETIQNASDCHVSINLILYVM